MDNQKKILIGVGVLLVLYSIFKQSGKKEIEGKDYTVTSENGTTETFKPEPLVRALEQEIFETYVYYDVQDFKNVAELDKAKALIVSREWDRIAKPKRGKSLLSALSSMVIWNIDVESQVKRIIYKLS